MLKSLYFVALCLIISSCSFIQMNDVPKEIVEKDVDFKEITIARGKVKKVFIEDKKIFEGSSLECSDKKIGMDRVPGFYRAYIPVDYYEKEQSVNCYMKRAYSKRKTISYHVLKVNVVDYRYPSNHLNVPKKHVDLSEKNLKRWLSEKEVLKSVYENAILDKALFTNSFVRPLNSKVTSVYGTKRVFNNKKESWHSGVDFRARRPTPIPSSNAGKVVFTGDLFFNGKTVIVDHGLGIMTLYCHLSKIKVKTGDKVYQKQILGLSGNTGRSNAPHLHWGTWVQGHWVDGLKLIKESKKSSVAKNQTATK